MRLTLTALVGLLILAACNDPLTPDSKSQRVLVQGVVLDSVGAPVLGARVDLVYIFVPAVSRGQPAQARAEALVPQTDELGAYLLTVDSIPAGADSLFVRIRSPNCDEVLVPQVVAVRPRTAHDSVYTLDFTLPLLAPRPSPQAHQLCAHDRHPTFFFNYQTYLKIDSTQTIVSPASTLFGGSWDHHTSGSTVGDTGTFVGVVTATSVVIDLTYATPGPVCGPTQRLAAPVLPDGRWGMVLNAGDPACPVATLPLAFAPFPMP